MTTSVLTIWLAAAIALPAGILTWHRTELRLTPVVIGTVGLYPAIAHAVGLAKHHTWDITAAKTDLLIGMIICLIIIGAATATWELRHLYGYLGTPPARAARQD